MWPYKNGLGIRLSYGVDGGGIVVVGRRDESSPQDEADLENGHAKLRSTLDVPRGNDSHYFLNEVIGSFLELVMSQLSPEMHGHNNLQTTQIMNTYIPGNILASYGVESQTLMSNVAYDPTYGRLFEVFEVRNVRGKAKALAFVTGDIGNILNLTMIGSRSRQLHVEGSKTAVKHPDFGEPLQIDLSETIKQIASPASILDPKPPYLLIRTRLKIYVLRCSKSKAGQKARIETDVQGHISVNDLAGYDFADVSFSPYDCNQISIIDIKGNFGIWSICKTSLGPNFKRMDFGTSSTAKPTVHDASELSSWNRICWELDSDHLLVISRSSVLQFAIDKEKNLSSKKLVTSNTWSKIQDFHLVNKNAFLLTSKELIWFSSTNSLERLMSWKHFLADLDPSLKLHVTAIEDNRFVCLIISEMHPLIFVYNFGLRDGKPVSLYDPYIIRKSGGHGNLKQVALYALADFNCLTKSESYKYDLYVMFQLTTDYRLSTTTYANQENLKECTSEIDGVIIKTDPKNHEYGRNALDATKYTKSQITKLIDLMDCHEYTSEDAQIESIRNYAFSLGEGVAKLNNFKGELRREYPSFLSLLDISKDIPVAIENVSEVDTMVEQLALFYEDKNIKVSSLINNSLIRDSKLAKALRPKRENRNIEDLSHLVDSVFSRELLKEFNKSVNIKKTSILLGTSLIKAKSEELSKFYTKSLERLLNSVPTSIKSVLGDWDTASADISTITKPSRNNFASQVPTFEGGSQQKQGRGEERGFSQVSQIDAHERPIPLSQTRLLASETQGTQRLQTLLSATSSQSSQLRSRQGSQKRTNLSQVGSQIKPKKKKKGGFA